MPPRCSGRLNSSIRYAETRTPKWHVSFCTSPPTPATLSRFLRRFRHFPPAPSPTNGPPLDHGGTGRALPHAHRSAPAKGHRRARPGGVTQATGWQAGRFRYYELAPRCWPPTAGATWSSTHTTRPCCRQPCVQAGGLCLRAQRGLWWQHGHSSERDFIYVTTQTPGAERLDALAERWAQAQPAGVLRCLPGVTAARKRRSAGRSSPSRRSRRW